MKRLIWIATLFLMLFLTASPKAKSRGDEDQQRDHSLRQPNPLVRCEPRVVMEEAGAIVLRWDLASENSRHGAAESEARRSREEGTAPLQCIAEREDRSNLPHLQEWRQAIIERTGPVSDHFSFLRLNRTINPWLEAEDEQQREINQRVESGELGRMRPMSILERRLIDYHVGRYPMLDLPSEMVAVILRRGSEELRTYYVTDGEGLPPMNAVDRALEEATADAESGWVIDAVVHNHTFDFSSERGLLAIAAPSVNDLALFENLSDRLTIGRFVITDGFNSFELEQAELAADSVRIGHLTTSDGVNLRFLERGEGTPIILVAGWTMPAEVWAPQLDELSADARVIAFDPRGQGGSQSPDHGYTLARRTRDLSELIEQRDLRDVILVGWSLGGFDVLGYLQSYGTNRVAAVVLIDGEIVAGTTIERARAIVGALQAFQDDRSAFASRFVRSLFRHPQPEAFIEELIGSVEEVSADASVAVATNYMFLDMSNVVAKLDRPLLYLVTPQLTEQARLVEESNENALTRIFEESGHAIFVDEAAVVNRLIRDLLPVPIEARDR